MCLEKLGKHTKRKFGVSLGGRWGSITALAKATSVSDIYSEEILLLF